MTPNDDLARWGEPPADPSELALAHWLGELSDPADPTGSLSTDSLSQLPPALTTEGAGILRSVGWIQQTVDTLLACTGMFANPPGPVPDRQADVPANLRPVQLRLIVRRQHGPDHFVPVATTVPPTVLRDLRRVPAETEQAVVRTGDRVRIEVLCDRSGYLTVYNVGPTGTLNLLHPTHRNEAVPQPADQALHIADVELTPPAGREWLYAVWSRTPLTTEQLRDLSRPDSTLRDMQRVQQSLDALPAQDWHAIVLQLDHRG